jgi:hypothetical protein
MVSELQVLSFMQTIAKLNHAQITGNITRRITKYITEPDGRKRSEKSVEYIPARKLAVPSSSRER